MNIWRWLIRAAFAFLLLFTLLVGGVLHAEAGTGLSGDENPVPMLAYYYIWFDSGSWDRAKIDYPLLGHYSSDDEQVMLRHIRWAKNAGISGFIVSWKSTEILNRRLDLLVKLAKQEDFKLAVIYQGLNFDRNPLPTDRVASDLAYFVEHYAANPVFHLYSKPVVIWSGTWEFSPAQIEQAGKPVRNSIYLLASERNLDGIKRLSGLVDGDAYYWSSVNPDTYAGYAKKLNSMGQELHQQGGLWIAPAAPGFDARLVGGTSVVERKDGDTFRIQLSTAIASSPDAVGIISWNEFSENSQIEPSQTYGSHYLDILSEINHLPPPVIGEFDSSEPAIVYPEIVHGSRTVALAGLSVLLVSAFIVITRRRS